ncbi:hypothetical protein RR42_s0990 [Cupriavidus basilensis]|uniref:Uncharacterized protein n=1 Tax=Cupriavidus basilensis TaxID=68895 RepID=A0A0C4YIW9_9BURK|nr:hypothetical protein RR42_s0990 [Cupriavidus basilensis]
MPEFHRITQEQVVMLNTQSKAENLEHEVSNINTRGDFPYMRGVL